MEIQDRLVNLSRRIETLRTEKSRIEGQAAQLERDRARIHEQCREMDIEPEDLGKVIRQKRSELDILLQTIESKVRDIENKRTAVTE